MAFYTYAYLREDRSPYYIGKGKGDRAYKKYDRTVPLPKDKSRILILKKNLTEVEAFRHEVYMIAVYGRKDLGTGILRNMTNGGEGVIGYTMKEKQRIQLSEYSKNRSKEHRRKLIKTQVKYNYTIYSTTEDKIYEINNLREFCREHSLDFSSLKRTFTGERNHHKGFKILKKESISALP